MLRLEVLIDFVQRRTANGIQVKCAADSLRVCPFQPSTVKRRIETDRLIDFYPDSYDVTLLWSDATFDDFLGIDVFDHQTTTLIGTN